MNIRVRLKANFPSNIRADGGIGIDKENGEWAIVPKWEDLTQIVSVPDPNNYEIWTRKLSDGTYNRMTAQALVANAPAGPTGAQGPTGAAGSDGVLSNSYLAKTAAYTAANADKGKTIVLSGGFFTLTFNAISGGNYDANYLVVVHNADTGRAKRITAAGVTSFRLWPGQSVTIRNENGVWVRDQQWDAWRAPAGITLYVDELNGSDSNDGMVAGTGNALQTLNAAIMDIVHNEWFMSSGSPQVTVQLTDNGTAGVPAALGYAPLHFSGGLSGSEGRSTVIVQGNASDPTKTIIIGTAAGSAVELFGNARIRLKNVTLRGTAGASCLSVNDGAECRIQTGVRFQPAPGSAQIGINAGGRVIMEDNITVDTGTSNYFIQMTGNAWFDTQAYGVTWSNSHTYSIYVLYIDGSSMLSAYGTAWAITVGTVTGTKFYCDNNSVLGLNAVDPNTALTFGTVNGVMQSGGRAGIGSQLNFQRRARTAAYTVQQSDDGRKLCLGGAAMYSVAFSAVGSYSDSFCCVVSNEDTVRCKDVILSGVKTVRLYPSQHMMVWSTGTGGTWGYTEPGRYRKTSHTFYVDAAGNDTTGDGTAAGPFLTVQNAVNRLLGDIDCSNSPSTISVGAGTFNGAVTIQGQPTGYNFFYLIGSGVGTTILRSTSFNLLIGDNAEVILGNFTLDGATTASAGIFGHQTGVIDINYPILFQSFASSAQLLATDRGGFTMNVNANISINTNCATLMFMGPACVAAHSPIAYIFVNPVAITTLLSTTAGFIELHPAMNFSGAIAGGAQKWRARWTGGIALSGITVPGTVAGVADISGAVS